MLLISLLFENPLAYVMVMLSVIFGLVIHEYFHGWTADQLGDDTAKVMGRLTVNPLAHFDPVLTTMIFIFGIGAANPVPVDFSRLRYGKWGVFLVSAAGIFANLISALFFMAILKMVVANGNLAVGNLLFIFLQQLITMNLVLAIFNLLPLPPLDGSKIFLSLFPSGYDRIYQYLAQNQAMSLILSIILFSSFGYKVVDFAYNLLVRMFF